MSEGIFKAMQGKKHAYAVHLAQLRATSNFLKNAQRTMPSIRDRELEASKPDTSAAGGLAISSSHQLKLAKPKTSGALSADRKSDTAKLPEKPRTYLEWLLFLPAELRTLILEEYTGTEIQRAFLRGNEFECGTGAPMPNLAEAAKGVSEQLFAEALSVGLQQTVEIHSGPGNTQFQVWLAEQDLRAVGLTNGFDAVRDLSFPYFSRFPWWNPDITSNMDIELMHKCKNLRRVTLLFVAGAVHGHANEAELVATLRRKFHLDGILKLSSLQCLMIQVHPHYLIGFEYRNVQVLAGWFRDEFQKLGKEVDVSGEEWQAPRSE